MYISVAYGSYQLHLNLDKSKNIYLNLVFDDLTTNVGRGKEEIIDTLIESKSVREK
jgi:hypothetical protein